MTINNLDSPVSINLSDGALPIQGSSTNATQEVNGNDFSKHHSRLALEAKQWRVIGNIQNGPKTAAQQTRFFECLKYIFGKFIKESNGGLVPCEINQKKLRGQYVNHKKLNQNTISNILKFLLKNGFIVLDYGYSVGKNAKFYLGGSELLSLLDPKLKRKAEVVSKRDGFIKSYIKHGFENPTLLKECNMCKDWKELIQFSPVKDKTRTHPVCRHCFKENCDAAYKSCREYHAKNGQELLFESYDEMIADRVRQGLPVVGGSPIIPRNERNDLLHSNTNVQEVNPKASNDSKDFQNIHSTSVSGFSTQVSRKSANVSLFGNDYLPGDSENRTQKADTELTDELIAEMIRELEA